ncbi:MAG: DUF2974 domain-containing protein [Solobacterium sp.]|nr:DUF2974 domain-containing protein [Solobacterium sp.]
MVQTEGTIRDYIGWRGDLSFEEKELNDADNLVLCFFSYVNLRNVWGNGHSMTIHEAVSRLTEEGGIRLEVIKGSEHPEEIIEAAASSQRFGNIRILEHKDVLIPEEHIQFSASLYELKKGELFLAYRGTDASTAGWKEDFMITFTETKAQEMALSFLKEQIRKYASKGNVFYVGGHSKGGNLAMYASALLEDDQLALLKRVYVNDGPGFCRDVLDPALLKKIDHAAVNIVPEYCVIGKLFAPELSHTRIVKSSGKRILQHDCSTWLLEYGSLLETEGNDPESEWIDQVLNQWVENVETDDRKRFIDRMFEVIEEENTSFEELNAMSFEHILVRIAELDPDIKRTMMKMPESALRNTALKRNMDLSMFTVFSRKPDALSILLLAAGILLTIIPEHFIAMLPMMFTGVFACFEAGMTIRRLWKNNFRISEEKTRITICFILLGLVLVMLAKDNAAFLLGSAVFGCALLILAINAYSSGQTGRNRSLPKWFVYFETAMLLILGMFILVAPDHTMRWYCSSTGYLMIADSIMRMILARRTI